MSVADLNQAIELTTETHDSDEKNILIGLVNFGNISVREIMRVRMDVVGIDVESDSSDVFKLIQQHGYSRMPVYRENFDHVEGILFIKDLIPHIHEETAFAWRELIRPPMYVPEYKKIDQLLKEFQARHMHMAIVVDEYGASLGLVTMEDILEEIFGEIKDEYDDDDIQYSRLDDQTYLFEAKISLNDLCKVLELDHDFFDDFKGDSESLGGVIQEMEQRIPPRGTRVQIQHLKMTIESSDRRKINRVKIQLLSEASSERAHED
jgi:CBS domain containing-hemolysin-like protein